MSLPVKLVEMGVKAVNGLIESKIDSDLPPNNLMVNLLTEGITLVEGLVGLDGTPLSGIDKKNLVTYIVQQVAEKQLTLQAVDQGLGELIDTMVEVVKGRKVPAGPEKPSLIRKFLGCCGCGAKPPVVESDIEPAETKEAEEVISDSSVISPNADSPSSVVGTPPATFQPVDSLPASPPPTEQVIVPSPPPKSERTPSPSPASAPLTPRTPRFRGKYLLKIQKPGTSEPEVHLIHGARLERELKKYCPNESEATWNSALDLVVVSGKCGTISITQL